MGFGITPSGPPDGVYMHDATGDLIVVDGSAWISSKNIWYIKDQKEPREMLGGYLILFFTYLGEL